MGAWGSDAFANDDAMDWLTDLAGARDLAVLRDALSAVESEGEYIEAPACSVGFAAAEVVAALRGRPGSDLPREVTDWVFARRTPPDRALLASAARVVAIIRTDHERSELLQLWAEAAPDDRDAWYRAAADLQSRLNDQAQTSVKRPDER